MDRRGGQLRDGGRTGIRTAVDGAKRISYRLNVQLGPTVETDEPLVDAHRLNITPMIFLVSLMPPAALKVHKWASRGRNPRPDGGLLDGDDADADVN